MDQTTCIWYEDNFRGLLEREAVPWDPTNPSSAAQLSAGHDS